MYMDAQQLMKSVHKFSAALSRINMAFLYFRVSVDNMKYGLIIKPHEVNSYFKIGLFPFGIVVRNTNRGTAYSWNWQQFFDIL